MTLFLDSVVEPPSLNTAPAPFDLLVSDLFLKLESANSENKAPFPSVSAKKTDIIEQFVKTWRIHFQNNIYPAVRLIFPNRDGRKYHIKDVALTRLVTKLLHLQSGLADYQIIKNWKKTYQQKAQLANYKEHRQLGDLPLIIARIVLRRRDQNHKVKSAVSVADVNETLDNLTKLTQSKEQLALLEPFIERLTIPEVRFFFLMILKESMLSFFERSFFLAWHPDAYDLYKVCDDMKKIFWYLTDPTVRLTPDQLCVQIMYSFVPQSSKKLEILYENLCKRMTVGMAKNKDPKLLKIYEEEDIEGHFIIEEKIDGDRMLMHMLDGKFKWHTRRRRDYTLVYGENVHLGSLTKHLGSAFHESVKSIVLDGEMVAWDTDRNVILPFGTLRSAAVQEALAQFNVVDVYEGNNSWPLFIIFDILHLNGKDLSNLPLFYRKHLLSKVVREVPHRFELLEWVKAKTPLDIKANMQRIVSERNEGVMVKSLLLKYRVYSRDSTWIKVKPEYLENFGENLDLVVIGKIGRIKTSYICGLKDVEADGCYKLFCMVANGFSNAVYRQIESKLCNYWVDYSQRKPPSDIIQFGSKKPEHWIDPANLIVLEIKARSIEVTAETPYAAGSTLHNLWCRAVREDKSYDECITLQEYWELKASYSSDIYKNQNVNRNRKRIADPTIYTKYDRVKKAKVNSTSHLFDAIHFVVGTDYKNQESGEAMGSDELKHLLKEHGGTIELNPKKDLLHKATVVVLGQTTTPRLQCWAMEGFDIVRPEWVFECIRKRALQGLEQQFIQCSYNARLLRTLKTRVDRFGDSYTVNPPSRRFLSYLRGLDVPSKLLAGSFSKCAQVFNVEESLLRTLFLGLRFYVVALKSCTQQRIWRRLARFGGAAAQNFRDCSFIIVSRAVEFDTALQVQVQQISLALGESYEEGARLPTMVTDTFVDLSIAARELADPYLCVVPKTAFAETELR